MKVRPPSGDHLPLSGAANRQNPLTPGSTVRISVETRRGAFVVVLVAGRRYTAAVEGSVEPGRTYRARVVSGGGSLRFQILERMPESVDLAAVARSNGLRTGLGEHIVRAFVAAGLPLVPERLALAERRAGAAGRLSPAERARLAAVLEQKGLLDVAALYDRAVEAADGHAGSRHDSGDGAGDPSRGQDSGQPDTAGDRTDEQSLDTLAAALKFQVEGGAAETSDPLQLINHRRGRDGHWVIVPLEFEGTADFRASLRILLPDRPGDGVSGGSQSSGGASSAGTSPGLRVLRAVVDVRSGERRWTFGLEPAGRSMRVLALESPESPGPDGFAELADRLGSLGFEFHHRPMSKDSNDGFSLSEPDDIMHTVDSRV